MTNYWRFGNVTMSATFCDVVDARVERVRELVRRLDAKGVRRGTVEALCGMDPGDLSIPRAPPEGFGVLLALLTAFDDDPNRIRQLRDLWRCAPKESPDAA